MKKRESSMLVLMILFLFMMVCAAPKILMGIEDAMLTERVETYEMEKVDLTPEDSDLIKKLSEISIAYERGYGIGAEKKSSNRTEKEIRQNMEEFVLMVMEEKTGKNNKLEKYKSEILVIPSLDYQSLHHVWECYGVDKTGREYRALVDDLSGKILSFFCTGYYVKMDAGEELRQFSDKMKEYYGFFPDGVTIVYQYEAECLWYNMELPKEEYQKDAYFYENDAALMQ